MTKFDPEKLHSTERNQHIRSRYYSDADMDWKIVRVTKWGEYKYLVTGKIGLKLGTQLVEVIDVTNLDYEPLTFGHNTLLSAGSWETPAYLVLWSAEYGQPEIVDVDGNTQYAQFADLPVVVAPPSESDAVEALSERDEIFLDALSSPSELPRAFG